MTEYVTRDDMTVERFISRARQWGWRAVSNETIRHFDGAEAHLRQEGKKVGMRKATPRSNVADLVERMPMKRVYWD